MCRHTETDLKRDTHRERQRHRDRESLRDTHTHTHRERAPHVWCAVVDLGTSAGQADSP